MLAALATLALQQGAGALSAQAAASGVSGPVSTELSDGEYLVDVTLEGGSGRATVYSPATLLVRDQKAYARIEWSSSHYDYMVVDGEQYLPVNEEGNSLYEIPVTAFDEPMEVVGDTTAMSVPHEVEYTLTFFEDSIVPAQGRLPVRRIAGAVLAAAVLCGAVCLGRKRKRNA